MNKKDWQKLLPVIQAWIDGKTVQYKYKHGDEWHDFKAEEKPGFTLDGTEWRIKPEPREFWIIEYDLGRKILFENQCSAFNWLNQPKLLPQMRKSST